MTQDELRELFRNRLKREKASYIAKRIGVSNVTLSMFKTGKLSSLNNRQFDLLKAYLEKN